MQGTWKDSKKHIIKDKIKYWCKQDRFYRDIKPHHEEILKYTNDARGKFQTLVCDSWIVGNKYKYKVPMHFIEPVNEFWNTINREDETLPNKRWTHDGRCSRY